MDEKPDQVSNFFVGNGKDTGMATEIHNEIRATSNPAASSRTRPKASTLTSIA